jgi:transposase
MEVVHPCCVGLDVHKRTVMACVLRSAPGGTVVEEIRSFGTMQPELEQLRDWLVSAGCTQGAMEATGVYWKPVYNVLEGHLALLVVNPEHVKALAGRKTDRGDAKRLATLLRHGLLVGSFIPDRAQRELRELTRYRTSLLRDRARVVNRLQKTLEGGNLKLASVLTDLTGVSGQRILDALLRGEDDPQELAALAHGRVLRTKREALEQALAGQLGETLRFLVGQQLTQLRALDDQIAACDQEVATLLAPFAEALTRLQEIPGVGRRTAEIFLSEVGADPSRFPTADHLSAWAGLSPGNRESGGKRKPSRTRQGNPWLKAALTEAGWAAGRTKASYLGTQFRRCAARKGRKHAVVVVAHSILEVIYHLLTRGTRYTDLGVDYLTQRQRSARERQAIRTLQACGYEVQLTPREVAA